MNYTALTPDEHMLFFTVIRHCKVISRPMLSNVEWDQDNAGRIVTESLKQIQQVHITDLYMLQENHIISYFYDL